MSTDPMARPAGPGSRPSDRTPTGFDHKGFDPSRVPAISREITYLGQQAIVGCDARCGKAWGISTRPQISLGDDPDNFAYLADSELGEAPADPGTYEGDCGKPQCSLYRLNKWCVRQCERSVMSSPGMAGEPLETLDFSKRVFNQPWTAEARLASGIEAATADETRSGSAEGKSPVGFAETPEPPPASVETQTEGGRT